MEVELAIKGDVERLHLEPDDIVLITLKDHPTHELIEQIALQMRRFLDNAGRANEVLVFVADQAELSVVGPAEAMRQRHEA